MKTLYLLRHAKAEPGSKVVSDPARVLAPRGQEACALMGAYMHSKGYAPDYALCSPASRTKETFERVTEAAAIRPAHRFEDVLYLASGEEILRSIQAVDDAAESLLLVGHNPGMHHIALLLADAKPTGLRTTLELKYPTCALTVLHFKGAHWHQAAPGRGQILDFVTPQEM